MRFRVSRNRWEKDGIRTALKDSLLTEPDTGNASFALGVISTKTDPVRYRPPILPNEQNEITEKEQSLLLQYSELEPETGLRIRKRFASTGLDFTTYRDLNFFTHTDTLSDAMEYYIQIAFDSLNFYEITVPLTADYFQANGWMGAVISFNDITGLKFLPNPDRDSVMTGTAPDLATPGRSYPVKMVGNPNLFNVRFLYAGVRNLDTLNVARGELWINDIFLGNRKRDIDFAQRLSGSINMGNVISANVSYRQTGPDFRGLRQRRGSGTDSRSLTLSARTRVDHFVPLLGFTVPVSGNFSQNISLPKFRPNSDTEITSPVIQDSLRTETSTRGFSTSISRKGSKNPLIKYTFDKLTGSFSMSQSRSRSPATADTTVNMTGTADYSINFGQKPRLRLYKNFRLRFWPNSFNIRTTGTRRESKRYRNVAGNLVADPTFFAAALNGSGAVTYIPFPSLTTSLRGRMARDASIPHEWNGLPVGLETSRSHTFQANYKPPPVWLLAVLSPDFNVVTNYAEDSSPNVRRSGDPYGVMNVSNSIDASLKLRLDIGRYFGKLFGGFGLNPDTGGKRPPQPGGAGTQQPDTTATKKKGPSPLKLVKSGAGILSRIRKINASVKRRVRSNYSRVPGRPDLEYQFGLNTGTSVIYDGKIYNTPERIDETMNMNVDSGVQISRNIDVAGKFLTTRTKSTFRNSVSENVNTTWPDINMSWKGLEGFALLKPVAKSSSATVTYRKTSRETRRAGKTETTAENLQFSPSLVMVWKNDMNTTANVRYSKNTTDTRGSLSETTDWNITLDLRYSFAPGKGIKLPLPFLRNKELKSRLDTSVNMGYTRSSGRRFTRGSSFFEPIPGRTSLRVAPRATYAFSRALNGSFFVEYARAFSEATNQTTTTVRVGLNATFTF